MRLVEGRRGSEREHFRPWGALVGLRFGAAPWTIPNVWMSWNAMVLDSPCLSSGAKVKTRTQESITKKRQTRGSSELPHHASSTMSVRLSKSRTSIVFDVSECYLQQCTSRMLDPSVGPEVTGQHRVESKTVFEKLF